MTHETGACQIGRPPFSPSILGKRQLVLFTLFRSPFLRRILCRGLRFLGLFLIRIREVVDVMGDAVTVAALPELGHHPCRVRRPVAVLAFGYGLVFILVAEGAGQLRMLCLAGCKEAESLLMTGGTGLVGNGGGVGDGLRHVGLVALLAVGSSHLGGVGLVALHTLRNLPMNAVAGGTGKKGMLALVVSQLGNLRGVAAQARVCHVAGKGYGERSMRILVAV